MRAGIIVFPGTTCERDVGYALSLVGFDITYIWYKDTSHLHNLNFVVLPGGYSFGDSLMPGKLAAESEIGKRLRPFVEQGGLILGICNGCQILAHLRLIPGGFRPNSSARFVQRYVYLRVENDNSPFTGMYIKGEVIKLHIAHYCGAYYLPDENTTPEVAFRYCTSGGEVTASANPQGAYQNIAGVLGADGRVLGMMPHPERAVEYLSGSIDGRKLFLSLLNWIEERRK